MRGRTIVDTGYVIDGNQAIITETTEKAVTVTDLQREMQQHMGEQQRLSQQISDMRKRYNQLENLKGQIVEIMEELTTEVVTDGEQIL